MKDGRTGKLFLLLLLHFVLACSPAAQGQAEKSERAIGNVKAVDPEKNYMIVVTKDGKPVTLQLSSDTKVTKTPGQTPAKISDIKVGEFATVNYKLDGNRRVATNVEVMYRPGGCPNGQPCPEDEKGKRSTGK